MQVLNSNGTVTLLQFSAPIIECIDLGYATNLMLVLICLTAPTGETQRENNQ